MSAKKKKAAKKAAPAPAKEARIFHIGLNDVADWQLGLPVGEGGEDVEMSATEFASRAGISISRVSQMCSDGEANLKDKQVIWPRNHAKRGRMRIIRVLGAAVDIHGTRNLSADHAATKGNSVRAAQRAAAAAAARHQPSDGEGFLQPPADNPSGKRTLGGGGDGGKGMDNLLDAAAARRVSANQDLVINGLRLGEMIVKQRKERGDLCDKRTRDSAIAQLFGGVREEIKQMDSGLTNEMMAEFPKLERTKVVRVMRRGLRAFMLRTADRLEGFSFESLPSGTNDAIAKHQSLAMQGRQGV